MKILKFSQRLWRAIRSERGDTLIEVTFALAILGMVLLSSTVVAVRALHFGQTARERNQISNQAQSQAEAMRSFRDKHTWDEFLRGDVVGTAYDGVQTGSSAAVCKVISPCFHMELVNTGAGEEYVPRGGQIAGSVANSYVEIALTPNPGPGAQTIDFTINYGFETLGGGQNNAGHILSRLTNTRIAVAGPCAVPPAPADVVLVLDTSGSMDDPWYATNRLNALKGVASSFIDSTNIVPAANHLGLVQFAAVVRSFSNFNTDTATMKATINAYNTASGTRYLPAQDPGLVPDRGKNAGRRVNAATGLSQLLCPP